jgi:membrane-associated protease RseP (regulator of RpoE activity)
MRCFAGSLGVALFDMVAPCLRAQQPEKSVEVPTGAMTICDTSLPVYFDEMWGTPWVDAEPVDAEVPDQLILDTGCRIGSGGHPGRPRYLLVSFGNRPSKMVVEKVAPNSPAAKAGIKVGDVVHSIGHLSAKQMRQVLTRKLRGAATTIPVILKRDGKLLTLSLKVGAQCLGKVAEAAAKQGSEHEETGKSSKSSKKK